MDLIIGNPAGLWALLGVPAVVLIHLLQHEARRYTISTLFLVDHLAQESTEGRVIERIRNSAQLWLQLLAVLLLTWLLIQPRWLREDSFQRVVVVLDSSVSMRALLARLPQELSSGLARLDRAAARTEWRLVETDPGREALYAGLRLDELVTALQAWTPRLGSHSFAPAFQLARSLAGNQGSIVLVTDRLPESVPEGIEVLALGEPIDNVGFTGLRISTDEETGERSWHALVRNHGRTSQRRTWSIQMAGGSSTAPQALELDPGATRVLRGVFSEGQDALTLTLAADAFPMDDRLPMVEPRPKPLAIAHQVDEASREFVDRFLATVRDTVPVRRSQQPDVEILSYDPGVVPALTTNAVCLPRGVVADAPADTPGLVVHESHPLTDGLSWQGLLCRPVGQVDLTGEEQVLVWLGESPLIYLRSRGTLRQLVVAFDLSSSNAQRLPAFIVMLHRFMESLRVQKPAFEARNAEVNQLLDLVPAPSGGALERIVDGVTDQVIPIQRAHLLRAPHEPGLFRVRQGGEDRLFASARFSDSREADFRDAATTPALHERAELITRRNSRPDAWTPLWTLLAVASIIASWAWRRAP